MKKLLIILLIAVISLSTLLLSACGDDTANIGEGDISISQSSSKGKISRGETSDTTSDSVSTGDSTSDEPDDSQDPVDASYGASGDDYKVQQIDTSNLSANAKVVANLINNIDTVTAYNYTKKGSTISYAKSEYNKLTASEKAEVTNYDSLVGAENAYNAFVKSVSDQAIAEFKSTIEKLKSFQIDETFKTTIEEANAVYAKIGDQYKSSVANDLVVLRAGEFAVACSTLPDSADALRLSHVDSLNALTKMLADNSAISSQTGVSAFITKYNTLNEKLKSATVESTMIANDTDNNGIVSAEEMTKNKTTTFTADRDNVIVFSSIGGSEAKSDKALTYSDKLNNAVSVNRIMKGNFTLNAPCSGTLKLYVMGNDKTYVVKNGSEIIFTSPKIGSGAKELITVEITSAGSYAVNASKENDNTKVEESRLYVVSFSYPNLPA